MRSKNRTMLAALVAVLALGALGTAGAGSASAALPELKPTPTESSPIKFKATSGPVIYPEDGKTVFAGCTASKTSGEFINAKEMRNVVVTMTGCSDHGEVPIEVFNQVSEPKLGERILEIKTNTLQGHLAYINKSKKEVGLMFGTEHKIEEFGGPVWAAHVVLLAPQEDREGPFTGQLITNLTPVNKAGKTLTATAALIETKKFLGYEQSVSKFEGGLAEQHLKYEEGLGAIYWGWEFTDTLTSFEQGGKAVEVKVEA